MNIRNLFGTLLVVGLIACDPNLNPMDMENGNDASPDLVTMTTVDAGSIDLAKPTVDLTSAPDLTDQPDMTEAPDQREIEADLLVNERLTIEISAGITSHTNVKKSDILSLELTFTPGDLDFTLKQLPIKSRGNIDGTFKLTSTDDIVTLCRLYDDQLALGLATAPDRVTGDILFTNLQIAFVKRTPKRLTIRCTADSVIAQNDGDQFVLGMDDVAKFIAIDENLHGVVPDLGPRLFKNATDMPDPKNGVIITIISHGTLEIVRDPNSRAASILVADGIVCQNATTFRARARYERISIDATRLAFKGDAASLQEVSVLTGKDTLGTGILPSGKDRSVDVFLNNRLVVPADNVGIAFAVCGVINRVAAPTAVNYIQDGVPLAGNTIALGIEGGNQVGEWNPSYAGALNIRATGESSGERIYALGQTTLGNTHVIRKTKITISQIPLQNATLRNDQVELRQDHIGAHQNGTASLKKMTYQIFTNGTVTLSKFEVRRNGQRVPAHIEAYDTLFDGWHVMVVFDTEEFIANGNNKYSLHAHAANVQLGGDSVATRYLRAGQTPVTGYISSSMVKQGIFPPPYLDLDIFPMQFNLKAAMFLWSDESDVPHNDTPEVSRDWTDDYLLDDLQSSQVLTS